MGASHDATNVGPVLARVLGFYEQAFSRIATAGGRISDLRRRRVPVPMTAASGSARRRRVSTSGSPRGLVQPDSLAPDCHDARRDGQRDGEAPREREERARIADPDVRLTALSMPNPKAEGTSTRTASAPEFLTPDEVATLLRTSRKAIYAMVERRLLPGVLKIGRRVLIRRAALVEWLDHTCASSPREERR
jgi:excisionase family DNA binding protein